MCRDCYVPLVEKLPLPQIESKVENDSDYAEYSDILSYKEYVEFKKQQAEDTLALLCFVNSHTEAIMLETLLKSNGIPVLVQWRNGGDALMVYMAISSSGADLYVPSKLLEKANVVLSTVQYGTTDTTDSEEQAFAEYAKRKRLQRSSKVQIMIIVFVALIVIYGVVFHIVERFSAPPAMPPIPPIEFEFWIPRLP